jgi:hypothetical protein
MRPAELAALTVAVAVAVGGLAALGALGVPYHGPAAWDRTPQFSTGRAWRDVETLATRFPRRWSGSADRASAADWLATTLERIGLEVHRDRFPVALGQPAPVMLENVWAHSRGAALPDEIIVLIGNYDMAPTSVQAASDTAGHVGTILELARIMRAAPHRRTIIAVFPDGEEWGMLGARYFARTFPDRHRIVAALSIEDLDAGPLRALGIDGIGQARGFSPMWLRALAADAARREGYPVEEVPPVVEWLQRSILVSATDQGPFLTEGIAAVDLAGRGADRAQQNAIYHLPGDTIDKMIPASLGAYGPIQERIIRAIDAMPQVPRESPYYLRLADDRVVPGARLWIVQAALLLPLLVATVRVLRRRRDGEALRREWRAGGALLAVGLVGLAALMALPKIGLMPDYELYPPPPRHPALTHVIWTAMAALGAAVLGAAWSLWRMLGRRPQTADEARDRLAPPLLALLVIAVVAVVDNPFAAVTFLAAPIVYWVWIDPSARRDRRLLNGVLVGAGLLPVAALVLQYGQTLQIGSYILWYLMMGIAYGQFTLLRVVLALATIVIGARLLALGALSHQAAGRASR